MVMSDPFHLGSWLQAQDFHPREDLVLHTRADLFTCTFERDEGEGAISLVAQVTAAPGWFEIGFSPYLVPARWPQVRARLAALITALFEHHGATAAPLECLASAWTEVRDAQVQHAGTTVAMQVPEAEPDQAQEESGEPDFVTLTVTIGRPLAPGEWERWCTSGPLHALRAQVLGTEQGLIAQCRQLLRTHQHPLADDELHVLFTQDATCILTSVRGPSLHLSQDGPSLSIVHADGRVETLP